MVLCRFVAMSLANTAVSGAFFSHGRKFLKEQLRRSSSSCATGFWKKRAIKGVLPPYDESTDATAAETPQSLGLESAAVGRARPAADGGVGGRFGATWWWG